MASRNKNNSIRSRPNHAHLATIIKKKKTKSTKQYSTDTLKQKMTNKEVCNVSLARRQANKLPGQAKHAVISVVVSRHRQCHL